MRTLHILSACFAFSLTLAASQCKQAEAATAEGLLDTPTQASAPAEHPYRNEAAAAAPSLSGAVRIHVSPAGNDAWSGEQPSASGTQGPVLTLHRAQALARARSAAMAGTQLRLPIRVVIQPGTYHLAAPLVFTPADSGTVDAPVTYEAAPAASVTISGGVPLVLRTLAKAGRPAIFDLPPGAQDVWRGGGQFFVNGQRATLARQPKAGRYWFVQAAVALDSEAANETGREAFVPAPDAMAWFRQLAPLERARAIVQVMHVWNSSQHHLSQASAPADALRITPRARWAFLSSGSSQRYFVENVPSALTAAGEWIATPTDVRYLPTAAQAGQRLDAVLPVLEQLIVVRGDTKTGALVQNLAFRGLTLAHTRYLTPDSGFIDGQAVLGVGAAFEADGARNITIDHCSFAHTAGYGAWYRRSVRDSTISNSEFSDLGAGGIQVGVTREAGDVAAPTGNISILSNRIGDTGQLFPGAVGIWIGQGYDATVANNLIHDTTYTGISVGWTWGFGPSASGRHKITNNLLVNIGRAQLSDMGGIYTLGTLTGTVISGNVIREVRAYPGYGPGPGLGAWGLYNDEGSAGIDVLDNVVVGTDSGGYHLHYGRDLQVRQNVLADGLQGEVRVTRSTGKGVQATLQGNLILSKAAQPFDGLAGPAEIALNGNQVSGREATSSLDTTRCGTGCAVVPASVTVGAEYKDINFLGLPSATTARLASVVAAAGPSSGAETRARPLTLARAQTVALAPPLPVVIDLRGTAVGGQPKGLIYSAASTATAVHMALDGAAPAGKCLRFDDSAAFANRFDPHAYVMLNHEVGTSTAEFSILIDGATEFVHEWRDNAKPYLVGPSLRISAAGVTAAGKLLAPATVGQWMQVRVRAALGAEAGSWQLELRDGRGKTSTFAKLPPVSPGWRALHYAGFISNAAQTSSFCLAGISVTNSASQ